MTGRSERQCAPGDPKVTIHKRKHADTIDEEHDTDRNPIIKKVQVTIEEHYVEC